MMGLPELGRTVDVTLLVFPGLSLLSLAATLEPMRGINRVLGQRVYRWRLASIDGTNAMTSCGLVIPVEEVFDPNRPQDLLIVIAAFDAAQHATRSVQGAIRTGARNAKMIGGIESGSWLLALAGILDNHRATTHWEDLVDFAERFPRVDVRPDRWLVDGNVLTTGGAMPALDMMLALIRERHGRAAALDVASLFIYEESRISSDVQPIVSLGRIRQTEPRVAQAVKIMEAHFEEPVTVGAIARRCGVSIRTLENLFQRTLQVAPGEYYSALRINAARRLLIDTNLGMTEIADRTGFSSIAALSRAFRRRFGHPPSKARRDGGATQGQGPARSARDQG